jgi:hypothetical protein
MRVLLPGQVLRAEVTISESSVVLVQSWVQTNKVN